MDTETKLILEYLLQKKTRWIYDEHEGLFYYKCDDFKITVRAISCNSSLHYSLKMYNKEGYLVEELSTYGSGECMELVKKVYETAKCKNPNTNNAKREILQSILNNSD